jgi:predicted secreted acid phosphatase
LDEINLNEDRGDDPVISPTLQLYNYAKQNDVAVFFVTGRPEWMRHSTIKNLNNAGYKNWDGLILKSDQFKGKPAEEYKTVIRKQLTDKGYTIVVNVGDQESDFEGGYSEKNYKLPNPFYFIP